MNAKELVSAFWQAMARCDYDTAATLFADDYVCDCPQTREQIVGRDNFIGLHKSNPAPGPMQFLLCRLQGDDEKIFTEVAVNDGERLFRMLTFHYIADGKIARQVEYWPEDYPPPDWRREWVDLEPC
ncbi:nuclear transport factor 2 family protein [Pseudaeromonas sharmana]|uniref:Nuclear transport factor 2 family protein n=1 Tax=Pseudaeromonas sharmana TaxID=328412 RepID=A0ABV8CJD4_9GAMM